MPELAKFVNTDLSKEFTVSQVAEKHGGNKVFISPLSFNFVKPGFPPGGYITGLTRYLNSMR
jgi:hypothetical protein